MTHALERPAGAAEKAGARNTCRLCMPLGASLAFKGIHRCVPILHGSQGCSTYIRRFLIGHYREPIDIASSSFHETDTVFGGGAQLSQAIRNVDRQYGPRVIAVATTCLAETIGEDVPRLLRGFEAEIPELRGRLLFSPAPSYEATHVRGFQRALRCTVAAFARETAARHPRPGLIMPMASPADLRHLRELCRAFGVDPIAVGDYSDSVDGGLRDDAHGVVEGGTPVEDLALLPACPMVFEFGGAPEKESAGSWLERNHGTPSLKLRTPIGLEATDAFLAALKALTGSAIPKGILDERLRYLDSLVDGHKLAGGARLAVYGDADLVIGLSLFAREAGLEIALAATGEERGSLGALAAAGVPVAEDIDFGALEARLVADKPDLLLGPSRGYKLARTLGVPLIRCGFPIHDRLGAARVLTVGYRGAQAFYDLIVNTLVARRQEENPHGYFVY